MLRPESILLEDTRFLLARLDYMFILVAGRGISPKDKIIFSLKRWIIEKAREFQKKKKKSISALLTMPKPLIL